MLRIKNPHKAQKNGAASGDGMAALWFIPFGKITTVANHVRLCYNPPDVIYYIYPSELCGTARSAAIYAKTQYKGVSVMESKDGKKRLLQCVLCLLAIFVPLIIIELLFEKVYVFEWVFNHGYLFLFAVAAIISYFAVK